MTGKTKLTGHQKELRHNLYRKDDGFRRLVAWAENRGINAVHTPVTTVEQHSHLNREKAIDLMQEIEKTGIAEFKRGAGGAVSELTWKCDIREIGKAAREGLWG